MPRSALLLGASGLVGSACLEILLGESSYGKVHALVRRPLGLDHPKLTEIRISFDELEREGAYFSVDAVFCCLGTTMKIAGSEEAFRRVDHDYPLVAARRAAQEGVRSFLLISSIGASESSRVFYLRVKGETERDLANSGLNALVILRPSMILGPRKEPRTGEHLAASFMKLASPLMVGGLKKYRPIDARTIGRALVRASLEDRPGTRIFESDAVELLGRESRHA